jgi:hypothetical protein
MNGAGEKSGPRIPIWLWPPIFVLGVLGAAYPAIEVIIRISLSAFPFIVILHFKWKMIRSLRLWSVIAILVVVHVGLLLMFWVDIAIINFWVWIGIIIVESFIVGLAVIKFAPADSTDNAAMPSAF